MPGFVMVSRREPPRPGGERALTSRRREPEGRRYKVPALALGPHGNGRIGYWYTNSRFARGAMVAWATGHLRDLQFLPELGKNDGRERSMYGRK